MVAGHNGQGWKALRRKDVSVAGSYIACRLSGDLDNAVTCADAGPLGRGIPQHIEHLERVVSRLIECDTDALNRCRVLAIRDRLEIGPHRCEIEGDDKVRQKAVADYAVKVRHPEMAAR